MFSVFAKADVFETDNMERIDAHSIAPLRGHYNCARKNKYEIRMGNRIFISTRRNDGERPKLLNFLSNGFKIHDTTITSFQIPCKLSNSLTC